jgi:hypothetical protein
MQFVTLSNGLYAGYVIAMLIKEVVLVWQIYQCVQLELCIGPISPESPGRFFL